MLWNALAVEHSFQLYCAYRLDHFDMMSNPNLDPFFLLQPFRSEGRQMPNICNNVAEVVWYLANAGRDIVPLLKKDDLRVRVRPLCFTRGAWTRRDPAYDQNSSIHFFLSAIEIGTPLNPK